MTVQEAIDWLKAISVTLQENIHKSSYLKRKEAVHMGIQALREVEQYRALGTVEELKEAREKQVAKKPIHKEFELGNYYECPICGDITLRDYCGKCGQALKWGEEDD